MNSMNGDGCSTQCQKEPFFNCVGESRLLLFSVFIGVLKKRAKIPFMQL